MKNIAIMGSTGSIGTQTLDVIRQHPDLFRADVLTAASNWPLLAEQTRAFRPRKVVIADENCLPSLIEALQDIEVEILAGRHAIELAACDSNTDIVVAALVGYAGLIPTLNAIRHHKIIALANKETLVVAGEIMTKEAKKYNVEIRPVDSEHSAIFQCLQGEKNNTLSKIFLTASGGPFRTFSIEQMRYVTVRQALNHPKWSMGAKVTIDSASMMNKGFEMIEARWLFNTSPDNIEVVVHPQSIVHSMVEFDDGSVKAQLALPDMRLPIQYALGFPNRLSLDAPRMKVTDFANLTFESPDMRKFPLLGLAYQAIRQGGNTPCILNAANEVAVRAFLEEKITFTQMPQLAYMTLEAIPHIDSPDIEMLIDTHNQATAFALNSINSLCSHSHLQ